jgi:hypothetical protein
MFFSVTVEKALDNMTETEMIERMSNGVRLTEQGRRDLLVKGDGATGARRVVDDSGAAAKEAEATTEHQAFDAEKARILTEIDDLRARTQAEIDDLRTRVALLQPPCAPSPGASLWASNEAKLKALGVNVTAAQRLMKMKELKWSMDEFLEKADRFAPTLVLIKMKNGTECGGVAGVPWPKSHKTAADPAKVSFIFSLVPTSARFDLTKPEKALYCGGYGFQFGYLSCDLFVLSDGSGCGSPGEGTYAGPRGRGQLIGGTVEAYKEPYERWELWRL